MASKRIRWSGVASCTLALVACGESTGQDAGPDTDSVGVTDSGGATNPAVTSGPSTAGTPGTESGADTDSGPDSDSTTDGAGTDSDGSTDTGGGGGPPPIRPSAGCGRAGAETGSLPGQTTNAAGTDRNYDLFVPEPYDVEHPHAVIFSYHGVGGSANTNQFRLDDFSVEDGGASINVAPQGWPDAAWDQNHFVPFSFDDSVIVFDQVVDHLAANYCIDLNRVFVVGHSNGGQMAFHLGCVRGDAIRAIVPNGGRCFSYGPGVCDPYHAAQDQMCAGEVMVLSVMGEDDVTRHADEEATVDAYRLRHGCTETTEAREPEPCVRYTGCADGAEVGYCRIPGLGHSIWSDGRRPVYDYMMSL